MQNYNINLHDIKPLLEVEEYSFYHLMILCLVALVVVLGLIYLIYKYLKNRNKYNKRKDYLSKIRELDLNDTKKTAYALSFYGEIFKNDSTRHLEMFNNITDRLKKYKYKKDVEKFDDEVLGYIELYKEMLDV